MFEEDNDFKEEFIKVFNNNDIPEADKPTPKVLDDTYLNMEIALSRDYDGSEFARVTKRLRDANCIPIGTAYDNPILDSCLYEVKYLDGYKASLAANAIASNLFSQIDDKGNRHTLLGSITDHRVYGNELKETDAYIISPNGGKRCKKTTKGWEILLQQKDGSTTWETLKDIKESYPSQLAEYAVQRNIHSKPAFAWWVPHVLKKRNHIIAKVKSKYWTHTHKFGIRIPKNVTEAKKLDTLNSNTLWWDAIYKEMTNFRIAFETYDGSIKDLIEIQGYQYMDYHMIFDVKMGKNFQTKACMVSGSHQTTTLTSLTYLSVVSCNSVRIILTIAALND